MFSDYAGYLYIIFFLKRSPANLFQHQLIKSFESKSTSPFCQKNEIVARVQKIQNICRFVDFNFPFLYEKSAILVSWLISDLLKELAELRQTYTYGQPKKKNVYLGFRLHKGIINRDYRF